MDLKRTDEPMPLRQVPKNTVVMIDGFLYRTTNDPTTYATIEDRSFRSVTDAIGKHIVIDEDTETDPAPSDLFVQHADQLRRGDFLCRTRTWQDGITVARIHIDHPLYISGFVAGSKDIVEASTPRHTSIVICSKTLTEGRFDG